MIKTPFLDELVGQDKAKSVVKFHLKAYQRSSVFPNLLLSAPKGMGKTEFAKRVSKELNRGRNVLVNGSSLTGVDSFMEDVLIKFTEEKEPATLVIDEIHAASEKVQTILLSVLNPTQNRRTQYVHKDYHFEFDFRRLTVICATTDVQDVLPPLVDRLKRISLSDYSNEDLGNIVKMFINDKFSIDADFIIKHIAPYIRCNGRSCVKLAEDIEDYCYGENIQRFELKHWQDLKKILSFNPYGLHELEIKTLRILNEEGGKISLNNLSSKLGLTPKAVQNELETYLVSRNLMRPDQGGRRITDLGHKVVEMVEKDSQKN